MPAIGIGIGVPFGARGADTVANWQARVAANSGTVTLGQVQAYDAFVRDLRAAGLFSRMMRLSWLVGSDLAAAVCPLINTYGNAKDTNVGFAGGAFTAAGGLQGNASGYLDTGLDITLVPQNDNAKGLRVYAAGADGQTMFGTSNHRIHQGATVGQWSFRNMRSAFGSGGTTASTGHLVSNRTSSILSKLYLATAELTLSTVATVASVGSMGVLAMGTGASASSARIGGYWVSITQLTDAERTTLETLITALDTALGRS